MNLIEKMEHKYRTSDLFNPSLSGLEYRERRTVMAEIDKILSLSKQAQQHESDEDYEDNGDAARIADDVKRSKDNLLDVIHQWASRPSPSALATPVMPVVGYEARVLLKKAHDLVVKGINDEELSNTDEYSKELIQLTRTLWEELQEETPADFGDWVPATERQSQFGPEPGNIIRNVPTPQEAAQQEETANQRRIKEEEEQQIEELDIPQNLAELGIEHDFAADDARAMQGVVVSDLPWWGPGPMAYVKDILQRIQTDLDNTTIADEVASDDDQSATSDNGNSRSPGENERLNRLIDDDESSQPDPDGDCEACT